MATISEALAIAMEHHRAGRLDLADEIYRRILAVEPEHPDALHLRGVVAYQRGNDGAAEDYINRAIALNPSVSEYHNNLGLVRRGQGRTGEAEACYRRAIELRPAYGEAHNNLGNLLQAQGKLDKAVDCYRRALEANPSDASAHNNLGNVLKLQDKLPEAIDSYRRAVELKPDFAEAYNNLGVALQAGGQISEALAAYGQAIRLKPDFPEAHDSLGNAFHAQGRLAEAAACYQAALRVRPSHTEAWNNLGTVLGAEGKLDEAVAAYRLAIQLRPDYAEAHNNLGVALQARGELAEAITSCQRAIELEPDFAEAINNLGSFWKEQGDVERAVACLGRALEINPERSVVRSNVLASLHYCDGATLPGLAAAHEEFERWHAAPLRAVWRPAENVSDPERRLRLGFVSGDFGWHPVAHFLIRTLENLDRNQCEVVCYSDRTVADEMTARFQAAATRWEETACLSDAVLADRVRADGIDIFFDLSGHTIRNRLLAFARKPAPIQVTWIGYEGTTGLRAMDYLLADRHLVPPEAEPYYTEKILRMPDGFVCFAPPADSPPVGPLPAPGTGRVTFASWNNPAKLSPRVVATWAEILRRVPGSRLMLKYQGLDRPPARTRLEQLFAAEGLGADRVEMAGRSPYREYLAGYEHVDIALDPFPFNGGATTCEALWMGVPVVTSPGETFAGRHSLSHLSSAGVTETIAGDLKQYVELAVRLAGDLPRLAEVRAGLRRRVAESPLCDGKRFAANLMEILRRVWREWCGQKR